MHIEVESVSKRYARADGTVHALDGVSLNLPAGEFAAVVGPSGAGKSTLLSLIGGLDRADDGRVLADGEDLGQMNSIALADYRRRRVGFVFQSFRLMPALTVFENVMLPLVPMDVAREEKMAKATRAMEVANILHRAQHLPGELSGGEQQRAAIARAVVNRPELIIADEPTGELDAENTRLILELLLELNANDGCTVLIATHDRDVAAVGRRIVAMGDGRIVSDERKGGEPA
ncbi:MAG: ABC transporter ATP-binding protein [Armatimonadota bacterium]